MTFTRTSNNDYPIPATISLNGVRGDITNDVVNFNYKNDENAVKSIIGVPDPDGDTGDMLFYPVKGVDFTVAGVFTYDVERVDSDGYTSTHLSGNLLLSGDLTP